MRDFAAKNKFADKAARGAFWLVGFFLAALLLAFLGYIFYKGLPVLSRGFIFGASRDIAAGGGVGSQLFNTFYVLFLSLLLSFPVAAGAAVYLSEYAKNTALTRAVRISIECLASVPSIVLGLFGMIIFINFLRLGFSIIGGSLTLVLLNLPLLTRVTEESLRTVPDTYREASLALGATKWQTIRKVALPNALPGILTGLMLTSGRVVGESAILIFTAGTTVSRHMADFDIFAAGETLSVHIWYVMSVGIIPDRLDVANGSAALLALIILFINGLFFLLLKFARQRAGVR
jgi:phosphate transport system permease protein